MEVYDFEISGIHLTVCQYVNSNLAHSSSGQTVPPKLKDQNMKLHQHLDYEMFLSLDRFVLKTEKDFLEYESACVIIPPYEMHYAYEMNDAFTMYLSIKKINAGESEIYDRCYNILRKGIWMMPMNGMIRFYVSALKRCDMDSTIRVQKGMLISLLFIEIFHAVFPKEILSYSVLPSRYDYQFWMDNYMSNFLYKEDVNLKNLAKELGVTPRHMISLMKENYNCTFTQFLNRKRLQMACVLLRNSDLSNSDIAMATGYKNENYFYTCFKKEYKLTPQQYRKLWKTQDDL